MNSSCAICGEDDPRVLKQYHHVFGKHFSKEKILLCHNCHDKITHEQNKLPPRVRKAKSGIFLIATVLRSVGALLEVIGKNLIRISDSLLEEWKNVKNST
jgi:hypothetical protein